MSPPGLFHHLVERKLVTTEALAGVLALLPAETIVRTDVRNGEGFDSTRWPIARDAVLASLAAWRLGAPRLDQALAELQRVGDDLESLRALAQSARKVLLETWDELALLVDVLVHTHLNAADGLYAYHVHRGLPGEGASGAASLVGQALAKGTLEVAELVTAARVLVEQAVSTRAHGGLLLRVMEACLDVRALTGADACVVVGDPLCVPPMPDSEGTIYMQAAGPRLIVLLSFREPPLWLERIRDHRGCPPALRDGAWTLVVPDPSLPADVQQPAAVATLANYVEAALEAHLGLHPEDAARFPVLDDAALARLLRPAGG